MRKLTAFLIYPSYLTLNLTHQVGPWSFQQRLSHGSRNCELFGFMHLIQLTSPFISSFLKETRSSSRNCGIYGELLTKWMIPFWSSRSHLDSIWYPRRNQLRRCKNPALIVRSSSIINELLVQYASRTMNEIENTVNQLSRLQCNSFSIVQC